MVFFVFSFLLISIIYDFLIRFYRRSWNAIPLFEPDAIISPIFISVVISCRNEEKNIKRLLSSLANQNYPKSAFEVIIIDDYSTDDTWTMLREFDSGELSLKFFRMRDVEDVGSNTIAYKKMAIEKGISHASGNLIVTTDADCLFEYRWLETIAAFYLKTGAACIAAPVRMMHKRSLLSLFQTIDFLTLQGITGAAVYKRIHMMCNGANFIYEKKVFYEVGGFSGIDNIPSGDDMLLMQKIFEKYPDRVCYLKSKQAIVHTEPMNTWKELLHQRVRWASKATHYKDGKTFAILLLVYLYNCCFVVLAVWIFFKPSALFLLLLFALGKLLIEFPFVNAVAQFFGAGHLMKYFPILQPVHILYTIIAGWLGKFGTYVWKERKISIQ